ncbi:glutathione S-transferase family protein [Leptolyngbya cf. ectocarpi LEGE 11479]|uniref:Glutathione S-transferase family protein n=1 Tax=Leptolyngbya cf. ectocarpi LEGE 11479 TaxID=1828722 RepID=A0A928X0K2_LEPEC|nr:glutathione S-transferase family protein [Leptolyngbya ectocarpi]MBE9066242.1 glutathione S-transferase family protein [Leptolyngbya cf. ectocarpi LEGE 11479]
MLELHQFEASHYCEKVRLILDYKQLPYKTVEVSPGVGQVELYRLSGQRQVPVLKDGATVVADSSAIAIYLDETYPERPVLPADGAMRGLCLMLEDWADESIGPNARKAMIGAFSQHPSFRTALLPAATPDVLKELVSAVPGDLLNLLGTGIGFGPDDIKTATLSLQQSLSSICAVLSERPYLVGEQPTLADFTVAGLSMYLKFPAQRYIDLPAGLCDKGVPGLADALDYEPFWTWRDRLYADYRQVRAEPPNDAGGPVKIGIE